ncbi:MAG TPA: ABC transporter permease, partial [Gemmatimonadales bacterium]|nr:ABC transporter permease [Gemmatimonadales bacterium]
FDAAGLLTAEVSLPNARYDGDARRLEFFDQLETRLRQDRSVVAVGGTNFLPFTGGGAATGFHPTDRPPAAPGEGPVADVRVIDEGYLPAMRVPLLAGRMFDATDRAGSTPVVLVSQRLAQAEWPGESPIGKRLRVEYFQPDRDLEVIGVVGDVLHDRLDEPASPTIYYSARQFGTNYLTIVVRAAGDPTTLAPAVTRAVHDLDPLLPVRSLQPMTSLLGDSLAGRRSSLFLLGGFALAAMLLAAVGLYGVLSQVVRLRSREIGIRLALGSTPAREQQAVLGGAVRLVGAGAVVGAIGAVGASLALRAFLFAIPPGDPVTVGLVLLGLALVAITASLLPARRAARVDPATALRAE